MIAARKSVRLWRDSRKTDTVAAECVEEFVVGWGPRPAFALLVLCGLLPLLLSAQSARKPHPSLDGKQCVACHAKLLEKAEVHPPAKDQMCDSCHEVPAAGGRTALTDKPETLCYICHEKEKFTAGNVHGPVAVGGCLACHDPHGSPNKHLVRSSGAELCLGCHEDMKARLATAKFRHKPIESGCTGCHSPHSSPQKFQLKAEAQALCGSCHQAVLKQAGGPVKHAAVTEGRGCVGCHDPHVAEIRPLLRADGVSTCLACHNETLRAGATQLTDMKRLLTENKDHHGPIRFKNCAGCHTPHGGEYFRLLKNQYPKEFYAPFKTENFSLCFGCHDSALPRDERTTTLTDFRDGDRNLHFVHVNKTPKGRTCRACHETHASNSPSHIRESVPFGNWPLPINYIKKENGGSCGPGCHAPVTYDRKKTSTATVR